MQISDFPEDLFYTSNIDYYKNVIIGQSIAKDKRVHIMGLARDCDRALLFNLLRVERLRRFFKDSSVFILENDSKDKTKNLLTAYAKKHSIGYSLQTMKKMRHPQNKSQSRMTDMAFYRNQLLESIPDCDYVIIYDFDIIGGFSYEGILESLTLDYDCVMSNSILLKDNRQLYYDTFALRFPHWKSDEEKNSMQFNRGDNPIPVISAFGGLGIYRADTLKNVVYKDYDCEHVTLHNQINSNGYRICLNPALITLYNETRYTMVIR